MSPSKVNHPRSRSWDNSYTVSTLMIHLLSHGYQRQELLKAKLLLTLSNIYIMSAACSPELPLAYHQCNLKSHLITRKEQLRYMEAKLLSL